jgi:hypothetical protein
MKCRLSIEKITVIKKKIINDDKLQMFVEVWHIACRYLFSDESITLRNVKHIVNSFKNFNIHSGLVEKLSGILLAKMPTLGRYCCTKFTQYLLQLLEDTNYSRRIYHAATFLKETSPLKMLIIAALRAYKTTQYKHVSYKEFVSKAKHSQSFHPTIRLATWVKTIYGNLVQPEDLLRLQKLLVVDQIGFPYIISEAAADNNALSCEAFVRQGDYTDVKWLIETLEHR